TLQHDRHAGARLAGDHQPVAAPVLHDLAEALNARDLGRGEYRKHLLAPARVHARRQIGIERSGFHAPAQAVDSALSMASCRCCMPNETSAKTPFTKNAGVVRTPRRRPVAICSCTRWRYT